LNLRAMLKAYLGILTVLGLLMLSVPLIDIVYGEPISMLFLIVGEALILIGLLAGGLSAEPLSPLEALSVGALGWLTLPLISGLILNYEVGIPLVDSVFESVSGFTGTGFTVLTLRGMKHSIIFWRSLMQWTGELGFVVFAMVFVPYFYEVARELYGVERPVKIEASFYRTALRLLMTYVVLTAAGAVFYYLSGMTLFESVNHIMTTIATGGMSTYDKGYALIFSRAPITYVPVMVFMILGGMNLYNLNNLVSGRIRSFVRSEELQYYLLTVVIVPLIAFLSYILVEHYSDIRAAFLQSIFNTVSGITTTGFSIGSLKALKEPTKAIITMGMFIGSMSFSTAGGIKSLRLMLIFKKFRHAITSMIVPPSAVRTITTLRRVISESDISNALLLVIIHAFAVFTGATIISAYGYSFIDSLFEATSAASCVGLSVGVVSAHAQLGVKLTIISLMLLGRIEYLHLFLLISFLVNRRIFKVLRV